MKRLIGAFLVFAGVSASGQTIPVEPSRESGTSITGAFEGWFKNPDGTFSLLLGYYNRNRLQEVDIPIGPNNRIEPGGPDRGQPTHFAPGRGWGLFAVKVPADFGDSKITWTIIANGKTTVIPASLHVDYEVSPFIEAGAGNTPPVLSFDEKGASAQGPVLLTAQRTAKVGTPVPLIAWISDDAKYISSSGVRPRPGTPPVTVKWIMYRGPARVTFSNERPPVETIDRKDSTAPFNGKATTSATFPEPGEYIVHVTVNDYSGEGGNGFQCCWTTGQVKVTVQP